MSNVTRMSGFCAFATDMTFWFSFFVGPCLVSVLLLCTSKKKSCCWFFFARVSHTLVTPLSTGLTGVRGSIENTVHKFNTDEYPESSFRVRMQ